MLSVLKDCIPIIVGALIAIVPTMIEKYSERRHAKVEDVHKGKQEMYVELISLFGKVLKNKKNTDIDLLTDRINLM